MDRNSTAEAPKKMIENSDRGVTLNKQLAWTLLVAVVSLVWFGGTTITRLQTSTETLVNTMGETRSMIAAERLAASSLEARIRALETASTRQDARFDSLNRSIEELKSSVKETNDLLRRDMAPPRLNP